MNFDCPEAPFEDAIIQLAGQLRWRRHAERRTSTAGGKHMTPIKGDRGFPDLVLVHGVHGIIIAELKSHVGVYGEGQPEWLAALGAHADERLLVATWRPADWELICEALVNGIDAYQLMLTRDYDGVLPSMKGRRTRS